MSSLVSGLAGAILHEPAHSKLLYTRELYNKMYVVSYH